MSSGVKLQVSNPCSLLRSKSTRHERCCEAASEWLVISYAQNLDAAGSDGNGRLAATECLGEGVHCTGVAVDLIHVTSAAQERPDLLHDRLQRF